MAKTNIEWADCTINPIVGCSKCSPGCENCYAEKFAARLAKNPKTAAKYAGTIDDSGHWTGNLNEEGCDCLDYLPEHGSKRVFLGSMTDMFHENMDQASFNEIVDYMAYRWKQHTFMVLTKRPQNARALVHRYINEGYWNEGYRPSSLPKNVWLGATVCNQEEADRKIPALLEIQASIHVVSAEPLLERIDLSNWLSDKQIDWVICGGETGPKARVMEAEWACFLAGQCFGFNVPFFFKQMGGKCKEVPEILNVRHFPDPAK